MLKIRVTEEANNKVIMNIDGRIDERANFAPFVKTVPSAMDIYCRGVTRINSIGVGIWTRFFHKFRCEGTQLRFHEVSPVLVDQMSFIMGFIEKKEVVSFCLPFECTSCSLETIQVEQVATFNPKTGAGMQMPCPSCGQKLEFLDLDYLEFLK